MDRRTLFAATLFRVIAVIAGFAAPPAEAQHYQGDFPPEEWRARWQAVYDRIGLNAVAVVQGMPQTDGYQFPRQLNSFYYLSGIETAGAYLRLDGRTRKATVYLPPRNERLERAEGKVLSADDAELVKRLTGADEVQPLDAMARDNWPLGVPPPPPAGAPPAPPREIALIRRASQIAGLGLMEAIRSTEPGVTEYQLDAAARYVFLLHGARLEAYRSITAAGVENINNMHYFRNGATLKAGDLVLMDYAPDYRYYVSDIGRMWPVAGSYAPWQREILQFVLDYRNAVLARIRPGATAQQIQAEAAQAMESVFARTKFSKPIYEAAAHRLVETGGGVFSHTVGMAVHDVGSYRGPLKPGQVFSVDPQLRVPEENLYFRYEDTVVVTETGVENFTDFLPSELDDLERLAAEKGVVQKVGPTP